MVCTGLLLAFLITASVTDIRWHKILNWTTYPGIVTALVASALATLFGVDSVQGDSQDVTIWGFVPFSDCLVGFFVCGLLMLVCYVFFPGGIGGGDVKLVAMLGAFLGLYAGLEALLWTFIVAGCQAAITLIWKVGAIRLLRKAASKLWYVLRVGGHVAPVAAEGTAPTANLFLTPSAFVAVVIVRFHLAEWLRF